MSDPSDLETAFDAARSALRAADALLVSAGAGMGVDSGLPDFRGNEGFWRAYPPFAKLGLGFTSLANPRWFDDDPALAWGFYGHRLELYRRTVPHAGFGHLLRYGARCPSGVFAYTSNVDGQFQAAGFAPERVVEAHGSIHHLQCVAECGAEASIWECSDSVIVDPDTMRAERPWPSCRGCGGLARPNILMFGDGAWDPARTERQYAAFAAWLEGLANRRMVIVEIGAGGAVPTVRNTSEQLVRGLGATLIRINPREPDGPRGTISLPCGALEALREILPEEG